jgi:hypothetical protein
MPDIFRAREINIARDNHIGVEVVEGVNLI